MVVVVAVVLVCHEKRERERQTTKLGKKEAMDGYMNEEK